MADRPDDRRWAVTALIVSLCAAVGAFIPGVIASNATLALDGASPSASVSASPDPEPEPGEPTESESASPSPTSTPTPEPLVVATVTISGEPHRGETLTAAAEGVTPEGTEVSFRWYRGDRAIPGAAGETYTLTGYDVGKNVTVEATVRRDDETAARRSDPVIPYGDAIELAGAEIAGVAQDGETLTAAPVGLSPQASYLSYQWYRDGEPVNGATERQFTLTNLEVGHEMSVEVSARLTGLDSATARSAAVLVEGRAVEFDEVTIIGDPTVGQVLRAEVTGVDPSSADVAYQWLRAGEPIPGATGAIYTLGAADADQAISVRVTATAAGRAEATGESLPTAPVALATLALDSVAITGTAETGHIVTAVISGLAPADTDVTYQWLRDGQPIDGATERTYQLIAANSGHSLSVLVTATREGFIPASASDTVSGSSNDARVAAATIRGEAETGSVLTARAIGVAPRDADLAYQWYRDGAPIAGATEETYTVDPADIHHTVTVAITATAPGHEADTAVAAAVEPTPLVGEIGRVVVEGDPIEGTTVTAGVDDVTPADADLTYQWYRDGAPIEGAAGRTHKLLPADVGRYVTVRVTATETGHTWAVEEAESVVPLPRPAPSPSVTPTPTPTPTPAPGTVTPKASTSTSGSSSSWSTSWSWSTASTTSTTVTSSSSSSVRTVSSSTSSEVPDTGSQPGLAGILLLGGLALATGSGVLILRARAHN
ncbi:MAG: hypothetical protein LBM23_09050 [Propionibacteriaceae bacterium]|jgi:hypothetical protein|nr:hypothetical protein [Propionibacteriaceae bacterium]